MAKRRTLRIEAVYEAGVFKPIGSYPEIPEGARAIVEVEIPEEEVEIEIPSVGGGYPDPLGLARRLQGEELAEALRELISHAAGQLEQRIRGDERLLELYRAADRLEPGMAARRIGPPPMDNDTWLLVLSDVLTVLEKAGLFEETRPLREAANQRRIMPFDIVFSLLRGDTGEVERLAERIGARRDITMLVFAAMAAAVEEAVKRVTRGS